MRKTILSTLICSALLPSLAMASGYRIPEQSLNSVALSGAYVANTDGADTSYFNPANMSYLKDGWHSDVGLTYINLSSIEYVDDTTALKNGSSRTENFLLPHVHMVSPKYSNFRFGVSLTVPAGLSKRWEQAFPRSTAEEFSLAVYEINPNVSYYINDVLSVAIGLRADFADGTVKSTAVPPFVAATATRDLEGDTTEFGYNLALTLKPVKNLSLAVTYRSNVDLDLEGDATLNVAGVPYQGGASVSIPLPAVLTWGVSYNFHNTIIELVYDKTFWGAYNQLDFNYDTVLPFPLDVFDTPIPKNWKNTDAFRLGLTRQATDKLKLMAAVAIDDNPAPDATLGFELPDSDAIIYSIGAKYQYSDALKIGLAYLYDDKDSRTVTNAAGITGTFSGNVAQLVTLGMEYRF